MNEQLEIVFRHQAKLIEHFSDLWREASKSNIALQYAIAKTKEVTTPEAYEEIIEAFNTTLIHLKQY